MIDCVDVFCGLGGLTHGLAKGGVRVSTGIDLDPECRFPYEANNEAKFLEMDVAKVSGDQLRSLWGKGRHTLLAGCAPCQPFSTYGRQKGRNPTSKGQWDLVLDFGRLIREAQPQLITMENVPQLVNHNVFHGASEIAARISRLLGNNRLRGFRRPADEKETRSPCLSSWPCQTWDSANRRPRP
jgi:DNA (cytosine-5)-methyltransferase 1